jgi:hypothetical protein
MCHKQGFVRSNLPEPNRISTGMNRDEYHIKYTLKPLFSHIYVGILWEYCGNGVGLIPAKPLSERVVARLKWVKLADSFYELSAARPFSGVF